MKADGIEYDERMERLEQLEHPKPNREFIYGTFNQFAQRHPWVGQENIRIKSIAREMYEDFRSFADYVKIYELQRAEGLLLRHLTGVYKALSQSVPDTAKNDALREIELFLGATVRQVDSSLLDEWRRMQDPDYRPALGEEVEVRPPGWEEAQRDITRDREAFTALVRNAIFAFLRALSVGDTAGALAALGEPPAGEGEPWTADRLRTALNEFLAARVRLRLDPEARNRRHTYVVPNDEDPHRWLVQQMLVDPEGINDWTAEFDVDLGRSREMGEPALRLRRLGPLTA